MLISKNNIFFKIIIVFILSFIGIKLPSKINNLINFLSAGSTFFFKASFLFKYKNY